VPFVREYQVLAVIAVLLVLTVFNGAGVYRPWRSATLGAEIHRTWVAWALVAGILLGMAYATKTGALFSRRVALTWSFLTPGIIAAFHIAVRIALRYVRARGYNSKTYVIVGGGDLARRAHEQIASQPWLGMRASGYFDDDARCTCAGLPWLGPAEDVAAYVKRNRTNHVYVALPMSAEGRIRHVVDLLADSTASVYLVPDIFTFPLMRAQVEHIDGLPVIGLRETPFAGVAGYVKRVEDVILATGILLLISPLLAAIAVVVKLSSPSGPVLFKQRRYGLDGHAIRIYKFRTMTVCEDGDCFVQATRADPRVTRVGAFLRRTSLDELPQFFNVLQGRMSIVGPRPHPVALNEQFRPMIKGYMLRHKVRPGITGLAQVHGWRGETDTLAKMEKRLDYDLRYIQSWSLLLDLRIIVRTIFNGFWGSNAY
jgi:putative colanic acid biosynthesis UDP-glucose lipid carrier transferase